MLLSTTVFLPAIALAAFAMPQEAQQASPASEKSIYPKPTGALDLMVEDEAVHSPMTMIEMLLSYGALTGQTLTYNTDVYQALHNTSLNLTRSCALPPEEVQPWIENLLIQNGFVLQPILSGEQPLAAIHLRSSRHLGTVSTSIGAEDLESVKDSAATIFSTVLMLPNTDVRQLSSSLRVLISDRDTQSLLPAGSTHSLHIRGFGPWVYEIAEMVKRVDVSASPIAEGESGIRVELMSFKLKNAEAIAASFLVQELISQSQKIVVGGSAKTTVATQKIPVSPITVLPDERTNSLIVTVRSDLVDRLKQAVALVDAE
jgi:hypothetical protein